MVVFSWIEYNVFVDGCVMGIDDDVELSSNVEVSCEVELNDKVVE